MAGNNNARLPEIPAGLQTFFPNRNNLREFASLSPEILLGQLRKFKSIKKYHKKSVLA
jgi:hypothetical protein